MVGEKILIDLWQFWPRGRCLLKRHLPQFSKSWCIFKRIKFKLNVFLEETPTISKNWIYIKSVSSSSTICQIWMSHEFDFKTKVVSWRDTFYIPKNFNLYKRCYLKRHFPQFHKFQYILKISLQETPFTIPKN